MRFPLNELSWIQHLLIAVCVGEAMEQGLRDCCRSIRIGKILIQSDEDTQKAKVYYAKFPPDISRRKVLLMYPILSEYGYTALVYPILSESAESSTHIPHP